MKRVLYLIFINMFCIIICGCSIKQKGVSKAEEGEVSVDNTHDAEALCETIKNMNYSQRIFPIDQERFDAEMEQEYKEAFYGVITNWIPMRYQDDGAVFFRDYLRGVGDLDDSGFIEALKHRSTQYSFLDYDGDGLPELAVVDLTYDGPIILKYIPEEKRVIVYSRPGEYWVLLGSNQMGYYNSTSAGITRYQYRTLDDNGEVELEIDFEIYYEEKETQYRIALTKDGNASSAMIDKEEWDEVTEGFFEAMAHPVDTVTFEEIFGGDFVLPSGDPDEAVKVYEEFLVGERSVGDVTIQTISSLCNDSDMKYLIYDISGDGIPELHIQTKEDYYLLDYRNDTLFVIFKWNFNGSGSSSCDILETGEIVYRNITPDMEKYIVYKFEFLANPIILFNRKDSNSDGVYDEYVFNDKIYIQGDQACTMEEWLEIAGDYLYTDEDGILQILDAVEWKVCPESAEPYEVYTAQYTLSSGYTLKNFQVRGMKNKELEERVNKSLNSYLYILVEPWFVAERIAEQEPIIHCQTDKYLSVEYSFSYITAVDAASWHYCITVDMQNGEVVFLDDIIEVNNTFAEIIKNNSIIKKAEWVGWYTEEEMTESENEWFSERDIDYIQSFFNDFTRDYLYGDYYRENGYDMKNYEPYLYTHTFYLEEGKVCFTGPGSHYTIDWIMAEDLEDVLKVPEW